MLSHVGKEPLDIVDIAGATGIGQKALLVPFLGFEIGDDIGTQGSFDDGMEAAYLDGGDHL